MVEGQVSGLALGESMWDPWIMSECGIVSELVWGRLERSCKAKREKSGKYLVQFLVRTP